VVSYKPIAPLTDNGPIEFIIPGQGEEFFDLTHTQLELKVKIVKEDGTALAPADKVGPVNGLGWSLIEHMSVTWNGKTLSDASHNYAYRANIENILTYGQAAQESHMSMNLWFRDTPGYHDSLDGNEGYVYRQAYTKESNEVELIGNIRCDVYNMSKLLVHGVEQRIKIIKARDAFCLLGEVEARVSYWKPASTLIKCLSVLRLILEYSRPSKSTPSSMK
jgi:hypothetical protein